MNSASAASEIKRTLLTKSFPLRECPKPALWVQMISNPDHRGWTIGGVWDFSPFEDRDLAPHGIHKFILASDLPAGMVEAYAEIEKLRKQLIPRPRPAASKE